MFIFFSKPLLTSKPEEYVVWGLEEQGTVNKTIKTVTTGMWYLDKTNSCNM